MTQAFTTTLAAFSVRVYPLILLAYPSAFSREFGGSMTQLFGDQVRDARRSGLRGLGALWVRTAGDTIVGLGRTYAREPRGGLSGLVIVAMVLYGAALAAAAGYGALRFADYYEPPAFSRFGAETAAGGPASEDARYAAYDLALDGEFGAYRRYLSSIGAVLAIGLGLAAALFGVWQRSVVRGALVFGLGAAATLAALESLPPVWFPSDVYASSALWVFAGLPVSAAVWTIVTAAGRLGQIRRPARAA